MVLSDNANVYAHDRVSPPSLNILQVETHSSIQNDFGWKRWLWKEYICTFLGGG